MEDRPEESSFRVAMVCQETPWPPVSGSRWKPYNILRGLAGPFTFYVFAFRSGQDVSDEVCLGEFGGSVKLAGRFPASSGVWFRLRQAWSLASGLPVARERWRSWRCRNELSAFLSEHAVNVIHLDMVNTAQYFDACGGRPTVLSLNDSPSRSFGLLQTLERRGWRRLLLAQQQRAYLRVEKELCPRFTRVHVVSLQEKEYLTTVAGLSNVVLIPISVDDRYFCIPETTGGMRMISIYNSAVAGIQAAVLKFAEREWAAIKRRFPAAHWTILGGRGASRGIRQRLGSFKDVVVQDWVASDVEALAQSSIYLAFDQLRGGMKNRVVQAMAAGRAVVGTPAALEGVDGREGTHFYVCEDSGSMRRASEELLRSADLQIQMGRAARDLAGELYSRDVVGEQWRRLYKEVAGPRRH